MKLFKNSLSKNKISFYFIIVTTVIFILVGFSGCSKSSEKKNKLVVVGIQSDVSTISPLYAFDLQEGHLLDLLFLKLAFENWNDSLGIIELKPMLAESWIINRDSNFVTLNLRKNLKWSDGETITADDIIFSLDIYSDPKVNSRLYGLFDNFYTSNDLHIDIQKTFRKNSETSVTIFFKDYQNFTFLDINHAIMPAHIYKNIKREDVETSDVNFKPVTSGPFKLYKWERDQKIHLWADSSCYLFNPDKVQEIIFKIIPDEYSLLTQLKSGEIDITEDIKSEKVKELVDNGNIKIGSIKGRNYDYVGWNHIDPKAKQKKQAKPNNYFSSAKTRKALSLAINRKEIFQSIVGKYGEIYDSPISPIFKIYLEDSLKNIEYNPMLAKKMLEEDGWKDLNGDGILEKNNQKFSFKIYSASGNSKREFAATIIKNNLKEIGIDARLAFVEKNEFVDELLSRKYDAWIAGWGIEIPLNLYSNWSS
ncbi:MAG: ABC transporter substrate-binding protein, partial [Ignavibacteriota bacterium]